MSDPDRTSPRGEERTLTTIRLVRGRAPRARGISPSWGIALVLGSLYGVSHEVRVSQRPDRRVRITQMSDFLFFPRASRESAWLLARSRCPSPLLCTSEPPAPTTSYAVPPLSKLGYVPQPGLGLYPALTGRKAKRSAWEKARMDPQRGSNDRFKRGREEGSRRASCAQ